ncbi:uncharacterized protein MELLADRAFT_93059 [Melampsora larici-populina 98AG31]|uniref:Secreted protein n=1 Tax=Melampsora larici-populina (strain 98AG31 / pathotype 3-4-7) TaxID=747676 RepID=F4S3S7_MELLP|nr:uncharacterized protein MELLADRAFT_93059 [Melampsora larici-populina 98AG31]EGG00745.1 secreted protein [Melampsora larici-populina 98AG31]
MRSFIVLNFVLLAACLARSQGQDALNVRAEIQARADASLTTPAASTDAPAKSTAGAPTPQTSPLIKDPKLCAIIVKRMKDFEAMSKNGGPTLPKAGPVTPSSTSASASKPAASGVARRSKLTQRIDIESLNRRDAPASKDATTSAPAAADPNACKEMETMLQAARDKMLADIKKGMEAFAPKKDSTSKTASTDATSKTASTDATPKTGAADATPKTGAPDATPKTGAPDATPKTGTTTADA